MAAIKFYLNEREKEVIRFLWEEKSNKEIAGHLFLSVRSVEKIRQDIKEKLSVKSTAGLFKYGINNKIIRTGTKNSTLLSSNTYIIVNSHTYAFSHL